MNDIDAVMAAHVCGDACTAACSDFRTPEGTLYRSRTHRERTFTWFSDEFVGPRAFYIVSDRDGEWVHPMGAPLSDAQCAMWDVVCGAFGSRDAALDYGHTYLHWPRAA